MSRAFVKEDVDPPERSGRARSASGLPPGAINYITASGAACLRAELNELRRTNADEIDAARVAELERVLASATIVEAPDDSESIAFGAKVTVRNAAGELASYRVVGVDELHLYRDAVTWVSPLGKALLAAEVGERVVLPESDERVQIVKAEYVHD
jgi:transcription elongation GreA/GreB family factor